MATFPCQVYNILLKRYRRPSLWDIYTIWSMFHSCLLLFTYRELEGTITYFFVVHTYFSSIRHQFFISGEIVRITADLSSRFTRFSLNWSPFFATRNTSAFLAPAMHFLAWHHGVIIQLFKMVLWRWRRWHAAEVWRFRCATSKGQITNFKVRIIRVVVAKRAVNSKRVVFPVYKKVHEFRTISNIRPLVCALLRGYVNSLVVTTQSRA